MSDGVELPDLNASMPSACSGRPHGSRVARPAGLLGGERIHQVSR